MQTSKNNIYSAADIERYHAGTMPAAEMHALEKAALDDPFLADALEGFTFTNSAQSDLQNIRAKLAEKNKDRKIVVMRPAMQWLKIAAAIIILAGSSWFVYRLAQPGNNTIALQTPQANEEQRAEPPSLKDTINKMAAPNESMGQTATVNTNLKSKQPGERSVNKKVAAKGLREEPAKPVEARIAKIDLQKEVGAFEKKSMNEADHSEGKKEITRISNVRLNNRLAATEIPTNYAEEARNRNAGFDNYARISPNLENANRSQYDNFLRSRAANASPNNQFRNKGYVPVDSIRNLNIVMQKDSFPPVEVMVLSQKKPEAINRPLVIIDTLEPTEGWARYDDYIANNLKAPEEFKQKNISGGEVQLSFDVNINGEPINIAVERSLCSKCDEEAIRLLKEGPKWKRKQGKRGLITIRFRGGASG